MQCQVCHLQHGMHLHKNWNHLLRSPVIEFLSLTKQTDVLQLLSLSSSPTNVNLPHNVILSLPEFAQLSLLALVSPLILEQCSLLQTTVSHFLYCLASRSGTPESKKCLS